MLALLLLVSLALGAAVCLCDVAGCLVVMGVEIVLLLDLLLLISLALPPPISSPSTTIRQERCIWHGVN